MGGQPGGSPGWEGCFPQQLPPLGLGQAGRLWGAHIVLMDDSSSLQS